MTQEQINSAIMGDIKSVISKGVAWILVPFIEDSFDKLSSNVNKATINKDKIKEMSDENASKMKIAVDKHYLQDFDKYAKREGVAYTIAEDEKGQAYLMYKKKDAEKMNRAVTEWSKKVLDRDIKPKERFEVKKQWAKSIVDKMKTQEQRKDKTKDITR